MKNCLNGVISGLDKGPDGLLTSALYVVDDNLDGLGTDVVIGD